VLPSNYSLLGHQFIELLVRFFYIYECDNIIPFALSLETETVKNKAKEQGVVLW